MGMFIRQNAVNFLHLLSGQPLLYAIKSPDTDLYDFGFGEWTEIISQRGKRKKIGTYTLHVMCRFKVIWKKSKQRVDKYYEDTPCEKFHTEVQPILGLSVKRVTLSDKNDLWLDLDDCWIVFATYENGEESWRFFSIDINNPHLVAADSWIDFSN